jgi:hypothetical protein
MVAVAADRGRLLLIGGRRRLIAAADHGSKRVFFIRYINIY